MSENPGNESRPSAERPKAPFILTGFLILSLLVVMAYELFSQGQGRIGAIHVGESTSGLEYTTYEGEIIQLDSYLGQVLVLNFWASWCQPCADEAALLQQAWEHYQPGGEVIFLGAAYLDTLPAAQRYIQQFAITYPNGLDQQNRLGARLGLTGVPETFIIDDQGNLAYHHIGPFISLPQILALVDAVRE